MSAAGSAAATLVSSILGDGKLPVLLLSSSSATIMSPNAEKVNGQVRSLLNAEKVNGQVRYLLDAKFLKHTEHCTMVDG